MVMDPLALKIVSGEVNEGDRITVDLRDGQIVLVCPIAVKPVRMLAKK